MHTFSELLKVFKKNFENQRFEKSPEELYSPINYTLSFGGKRIRPVMTLMACEVFGGNISTALPQAIAIELFHNFTLIHDDIMDKAPLRRGRSTVYKKWNSDIAILAGDTLFALAYQYAIQAETRLLPEILKIFNQTAIEVCEGQQFDLNYENCNTVTVDEYTEMIRLKTAVLFGMALKIGALIGGANGNDAQHLYNFGINLGLGFQLQDDLLDSFGNEKVFGKKTGGDILSRKKTFLYIYSLEQSNTTDRKRLLYYYNEKKIAPKEKIDGVTAIFKKFGVEEVARKLINNYLRRGLQTLKQIDASKENIEQLKDLAFKMINRDK